MRASRRGQPAGSSSSPSPSSRLEGRLAVGAQHRKQPQMHRGGKRDVAAASTWQQRDGCSGSNHGQHGRVERAAEDALQGLSEITMSKVPAGFRVLAQSCGGAVRKPVEAVHWVWKECRWRVADSMSPQEWSLQRRLMKERLKAKRALLMRRFASRLLLHHRNVALRIQSSVTSSSAGVRAQWQAAAAATQRASVRWQRDLDASILAARSGLISTIKSIKSPHVLLCRASRSFESAVSKFFGGVVSIPPYLLLPQAWHQHFASLENHVAALLSAGPARVSNFERLLKPLIVFKLPPNGAGMSRNSWGKAKSSGSSFVLPVEGGWLSSYYGWRDGRSYFHNGIDIAVEEDTPIQAANAGQVTFANWKGGYGKAVQIDHGGGYSTLYAHCNSLLVRPGQMVEQGQLIALSGNTGRSTGPHLHFEIHSGGSSVDPLDFLPPVEGALLY